MNPLPDSPGSDRFEGLWQQMHGRLCLFVCSRVSNGQDAEDLLQDIFLRAYTRLGTLRDPQRMESWIYQIARHRLIDEYRSRRPWAELPENLANDSPADEGSDELRAVLLDSLQALPAPARQALVLADLQGLSQQDLAHRLGLTHAGAKSRVQRARRQLKAALLRCYDIELDAQGHLFDVHPRCCC